jgi:hypothetical protein
MSITLLVDAGGTSVKWFVRNLTRGTDTQFKIEGMSPLYLSEDELVAKIRSAFPQPSFCSDVQKVEYYGTGCAPDQAPWRMKAALQRVFPKAEIIVDSDMIGAARVLWKGEAGTVGIIGTGSNAGFYDGKTITYARPSLGYLLGDEGSGAWLGKHLLRDWLYGILPSDLAEAMYLEYGAQLGLEKDGNVFKSTEPVMQRLFRGERPNQFLACFARFLWYHIKHPYAQKLVLQGMDAYVTTLVLPNIVSGNNGLKMVGSVAEAFQQQLQEVCEHHGVRLLEVRKDALP